MNTKFVSNKHGLPFYFYFIIASFLTSFIVFKQPRTPIYLKLFCPFLGITLLVENYALYLRNKGSDTYVLYSFFTSIEFAFYLYVLSCIIHNLKMRLTIRYVLIINALIALINILFIQKNSFNSISYSFSCLLIVFFSIYYFLELFRQPKFVNLINEPPFWICSGLLFYYCCSFPLFSLAAFVSTVPQSLLNNLIILVYVINALLYSLFIIAFLCRIRMPKYTSQ